MAMSSITVKGITPDLKILGGYQKFIFGAEESPEPLGSFRLDNIFVPTVSLNSQTNSEFRNNTLSGYRWIQETAVGDTYGSFRLQKFLNASSSGIDVLLLSNAGTLQVFAPTSFNNLVISEDLDMSNYKIINLAAPINDTDAATKEYVDNSMSSPTFTLTGAVNGSGTGTVNTTLASNINAQANTQIITFNPGVNNSALLNLRNTTSLSSTQSSDVGLSLTNSNGAGFYLINQITNTGGSPTFLPGELTLYGLDSDDVNYPILNIQTAGLFFRQLNIFADTYFQGAQVNIDGSLVCALGCIVVFHSNINMTSNKLINLLDPTSAQDAATKAYVDTQVATGGVVTLDGAVEGTGNVGSTITTTLDTTIPIQATTENLTYNYGVDILTGLTLTNLSVPSNLPVMTATDTAYMLRDHVGVGFNIKHSSVGSPQTNDFGILYIEGVYSSSIYTFMYFTNDVGINVPFITFVAKTAFEGENNFLAGSTTTFTGTINVPTPTSAAHAATKAYVDSAIDNNFGPNVILPFTNLNYDWNNSGSQADYVINHNLNDSYTTKRFIQEIIADKTVPTSRRSWQHVYEIGQVGPPYSANYTIIYKGAGGNDFPFMEMIVNTASFDTRINFGTKIGLQNNRIIDVGDPINAQDVATKAYVDTQIDNGFGPNVALPFSQLNFNWAYASSTNPSPYEFVNTLTDSQLSKNFKYRVLTGTREWNHNYTLIGNSDFNGIYEINYKVLASTFTPFSIEIYPFAPSQNLMNITVPIDMGGFEIKNALSYKAGTLTNYLELGYDGVNSYSYINLAFTSNDRLAFRVNGTGIAAFLATGLFGFGTITPTLAKVEINGGVQNITGEESAIRVISALNSVKIELSNTSASGKLYELRSNSDGSFGILDRATSTNRLIINTSGNLGISGSNSPNSALQFGNIITNRTITLWETANNSHQFYGFGINSSVLRYQVDSTATSHVFYAGTSPTTSNELFRINGNGDTVAAGTIYGRRVSGLISMQGNGTGTTVSTANTFFKVAGTTTSSNLNQTSMPQSNRITYTGTNSIFALISCSFTATWNTGNSDEIIFAVYKNGSQIPESRISFDLNNIFGTIPTLPFSINTITSLNTTDYVELWVTMNNATRIVTVSRYMMTLTAI